MEAVGTDVQAEREEGLRDGARTSSPAVAARLPGTAGGRRAGTGTAMGTLSPALLPGTFPLRTTASASPRRKTSLMLSAANST